MPSGSGLCGWRLQGASLRWSPCPPLQDLGVAGAGFVVGIVNTIAGAGSLLSFPVLLATGLSPLAANVTNTIGVVPATISGSYAQRSKLDGERGRLLALSPPMAIGSVIGTVLLLTLPGGFFNKVIPVLVAVACVLVLGQPLVGRSRSRSGGAGGDGVSGSGAGDGGAGGSGNGEPATHMRAARIVMFVLGIYGGYFGAAIGILLIGLLGLLLPVELRRINALKTVLAGVANGTAGVVFAFLGPVHWFLALLLGVSGLLGGPIGARLSLRIPAGPLRVIIAVIGFAVAVHLGIDAY